MGLMLNFLYVAGGYFLMINENATCQTQRKITYVRMENNGFSQSSSELKKLLHDEIVMYEPDLLKTGLDKISEFTRNLLAK